MPSRLVDGRFRWAVGIEDTFVPQVALGRRALDDYELTQHYVFWREDLALAAAAGATTIRYGFPWYRLEPEPGRFVWDWADRVVDRLGDAAPARQRVPQLLVPPARRRVRCTPRRAVPRAPERVHPAERAARDRGLLRREPDLAAAPDPARRLREAPPRPRARHLLVGPVDDDHRLAPWLRAHGGVLERVETPVVERFRAYATGRIPVFAPGPGAKEGGST